MVGPRRPSASQFHRRESDLVADLVGHLPGYLHRVARECAIQTEVRVGSSIADVVAALVPTGATRLPPPLSARESVIVSALRQSGPTRIDVLERRCGMPAATMRGGILARLESVGLVCRGAGGRIALGHWCRASALIAIEAKLTRWVDALEQALAYRQFADRVYVALPADRVIQPLRARAMFERAGVGLLSVNGKIRCEIRARALIAHDWRREYVYSRLARVVPSAVTPTA